MFIKVGNAFSTDGSEFQFEEVTEYCFQLQGDKVHCSHKNVSGLCVENNK